MDKQEKLENNFEKIAQLEHKIKSVEHKIKSVEQEKRIQSKYGHKQRDTKEFDQKIRMLHRVIRGLLKKKEKLARKIEKIQTKK